MIQSPGTFVRSSSRGDQTQTGHHSLSQTPGQHTKLLSNKYIQLQQVRQDQAEEAGDEQGII